MLFQLYYAHSSRKASFIYRMSILDSNDTKHFTKEHFWDYIPNEFHFCNYTGITYISYDTCKPYIVNDALTLHCEVDIVEVHNPPPSYITSSKVALSQNYKNFLDNGSLNDVIVIADGKEFAAHKAILAAQSPVLCAMFSNDCKEKVEGRVELPDISVGAAEQLLRFIYSGEEPKTKEHFVELFCAADKYQMGHLKTVTAGLISENLDVNTVAEVLLLADIHQEPNLKEKCMDYVVQNSALVMQSEGWKKIPTRPDLVLELFECFSIKTKPLLK